MDQSLIKYDASAKGSPYFPKKFAKAELSYLGQDSVVMVRFDSYANQIELADKDGERIRLNPDATLKIRFLKEKTVIESVLIAKDNLPAKHQFVEVLKTNGDNKLVRSHFTTYKPKKLAETPFERDESSEYVKEPEVYYLISNNVSKQLPQRKKQLISTLSTDLPEIKSYLKKNKIQTNKPAGMLAVFDYWLSNKK